MNQQEKLHSLPVAAMEIKDHFWKGYMELIRNHVIPYQWEALNDRIEEAEPSHCIQNFRIAAGIIPGQFQGMVFQDSDVYKWLEAVAYSLEWHPDGALEALADEAVDIICAAQQEDGYLNTYYIINGIEKRFTDLRCSHELYCLGHMIEAAAAYYQATGKRKLMDASIRFIECVEREIGPEEGKKHGYPGHEVIELALVKLYQITGDSSLLNLAKYFIDMRGQEPLYLEEETQKNGSLFTWEDSYMQYQYYQAGKPVRAQDKAEGHAVRAVYLYSGMADVAWETQDEELFDTCCKLWNNITGKQMYITGAIGAAEHGEAFTYDYDLPNDTAYGETCAAIGLIFFSKRMFDITRNSKYMDIVEKVLYNAVISGMSMDGEKFFYVNPLEVVPEACEKDYLRRHVKAERQRWFGCACCPPNAARLLASIGGYAYEQDHTTIYMNLYIGGNIRTSLGGQQIEYEVETDYPWKGDVKVSFRGADSADFTWAVRIPGWCGSYKVWLNGQEIPGEVQKGYLKLTRTWRKGDELKLTLDMPAQLIISNPRVRENIGKAAVARGPVIYCLEEADNGKDLHQIYINSNAGFMETRNEEFLNGAVMLESWGLKISEEEWDEEMLYQKYRAPHFEKRLLKWIPYYTWANRTPGEMRVWVNEHR